MNSEQTKSLIAAAVIGGCGIAIGYAVAVWWTTPDQMTAFLSSQLGIAIIGMIATAVLRMIQKNAPGLIYILRSLPLDQLAKNDVAKELVKTVNALPQVKGVVTTNSAAGEELADSVPDNSIVMAGTPEAASVATKTGG